MRVTVAHCLVTILLLTGCSLLLAGPLLPLPIENNVRYSRIGAHIESYTGPRNNSSLSVAQDLYAQGEFAPLGKETADFGLADAGIWLKFSLITNGNSSVSGVLDTGVPFLRAIQVWAVPGAEIEPILSDGRNSRFDDREQPRRLLVSKEFTVDPIQPTVIWIYFESDSTSSLPLEIYSSNEIYKAAVDADIPLIVFYTIALLFLAFVLVFAFTLSSKVAFLYAIFFACVLAYNAQLTGTLFMYVWSGHPVWNALASHPLGMAAMIFALLMGLEFIKTGKPRRKLRLLVLMFIALLVVYTFAPLVLPLITTKKIAGPIVLTFLSLQVVLSIVAFRDKTAGSLFYVLGSLTLFGYIGMFTLLTQGHFEIDSANKELMIRYGQLVDGLIFSFAVVRQTWVLRDDAQHSRRVAQASTLELATTRHDLRQPLLSLKTALGSSNLKANTTTDHVRESLNYLEALVQEPASENGRTPPPAADDTLEKTESENLPKLLANLRMMFDQEAQSKGIDLRIVESSLLIVAPPVQLFRVLANLISNAIAHSGGTRILLGVRRDSHTISIHCIDNGTGIRAERFKHLQNQFVKSASSSGEGLGLNIVSQVCQNNEWQLRLHNKATRGAHLIISNIQKS